MRLLQGKARQSRVLHKQLFAWFRNTRSKNNWISENHVGSCYETITLKFRICTARAPQNQKFIVIFYYNTKV